MRRSKTSRLVEAHPRLHIGRKPGELERGDVGRFHTELGTFIGEVFLGKRLDGAVGIVWHFVTDRFGERSAQCQLTIRTVASKVGGYRRYFRCGRCDRNVRTLVYKGPTWMCAKCQGLVYRSQNIPKDVALWEERLRLEKRIGRGRPKGMHQATYGPLRTRLRQLRRVLGPTEKVASVEHNMTVTPTWLPRAEGALVLTHPTIKIDGDGTAWREPAYNPYYPDGRPPPAPVLTTPA